MKAKRALTCRADALPALAEVFRIHGFEGTSITLLSKATGLGKGSLYNFFPGGKEEMLSAVLGEIDRWFVAAVFRPLEQVGEPSSTIIAMIANVREYFHSGARTCLVGSVGLAPARDIFFQQVQGYFSRWVAALAHCLEAGQIPASLAEALAEDAVSGIQGAIVLARAMRDEAVFERIVSRREGSLLAALRERQGESGARL